MIATNISLWPHQKTSVLNIEKAWNSGIKAICQQLSTGGGKTRIIRAIVDIHYNTQKTIYILAHRDTLVQQLSDDIIEQGIRHGVIKSGSPYIKYRVQVCSVQTLVRRLDKVDEPDIIIIDEFHHVKANSYLKILKKWQNAKLLGMTATPARPDGKPLSDICQKLFLGPQPSELIKDGYLADFDYFAPGEVDMSGIKKSCGDYNMTGTLERVDKPIITGSAVEHYKKYADHKPAIACCVNIQHSEHVAAQFVEAGYVARAVHSKMDKQYIKDSIQGLKNGSVEVLCQCDLLGEGVDIKGAVALIMLRPTASIVIFLQQCGRVLRAMEGKRAVILDHVSNWERHCLPDDDREWSLDGVCRQKEESKLKRCPRCQRPVKKTYRECPFCGYLWAETAEAGIKLPEERQGELINVKGEIREDLILRIARSARNLKQAVKIAAQHGASSKQAWRIWTHELKNKIKSA